MKYGQLRLSPRAGGGSDNGTCHQSTRRTWRASTPATDRAATIDALPQQQHLTRSSHAGPWVDHYFIGKACGGESYEDYHHKMTHYAQVMGRCARRIDHGAIVRTGNLVLDSDRFQTTLFVFTGESVEARRDNPAERAVLSGDRIGIVKIGGTGSCDSGLHHVTPLSRRPICSTTTGLSSTTRSEIPDPTTSEEIAKRFEQGSTLQRTEYAMSEECSASRKPEFDVETGNVDVTWRPRTSWIVGRRRQAETRTEACCQHLEEMPACTFVDVGQWAWEKAEDRLLGVVRS